VNLLDHVRDVPDFPRRGILFRDLTPLLGQGDALRETVERLADPFRASGITKVVAIEARGFVFGAPVAIRLGAGFVPMRKAGKLPYTKAAETYALEYGTDTLEIHVDGAGPRDRVLLVDDVLATGGTAAAARTLLGKIGAPLVAATFVVELGSLHGRKRLPGVRVESLVSIP
jgi:adenine phosphoribosyltransferase